MAKKELLGIFNFLKVVLAKYIYNFLMKKRAQKQRDRFI